MITIEVDCGCDNRGRTGLKENALNVAEACSPCGCVENCDPALFAVLRDCSVEGSIPTPPGYFDGEEVCIKFYNSDESPVVLTPLTLNLIDSETQEPIDISEIIIYVLKKTDCRVPLTVIFEPEDFLAGDMLTMFPYTPDILLNYGLPQGEFYLYIVEAGHLPKIISVDSKAGAVDVELVPYNGLGGVAFIPLQIILTAGFISGDTDPFITLLAQPITFTFKNVTTNTLYTYTTSEPVFVFPEMFADGDVIELISIQGWNEIEEEDGLTSTGKYHIGLNEITVNEDRTIGGLTLIVDTQKRLCSEFVMWDIPDDGGEPEPPVDEPTIDLTITQECNSENCLPGLVRLRFQVDYEFIPEGETITVHGTRDGGGSAFTWNLNNPTSQGSGVQYACFDPRENWDFYAECDSLTTETQQIKITEDCPSAELSANTDDTNVYCAGMSSPRFIFLLAFSNIIVSTNAVLKYRTPDNTEFTIGSQGAAIGTDTLTGDVSLFGLTGIIAGNEIDFWFELDGIITNEVSITIPTCP